MLDNSTCSRYRLIAPIERYPFFILLSLIRGYIPLRPSSPPYLAKSPHQVLCEEFANTRQARGHSKISTTLVMKANSHLSSFGPLALYGGPPHEKVPTPLARGLAS